MSGRQRDMMRDMIGIGRKAKDRSRGGALDEVEQPLSQGAGGG